MTAELCNLAYDKADSPWTYRCVLEKGHEGDCDPQLRPPPPLVAEDMEPGRQRAMETARAEEPALPISDEELAKLRERLAEPVPKMWNSSTMREVVSRLDGSERVLAERIEELANLETEGLLRMGIGDSFVRYHAHGEVLWPVYPNGMCRGCA